MDVLDADWFILQDPAAAGEHIILNSVGLKLSPVWLSQAEAEAFARSSPAAVGMLVQKLDGFALKEAFLTALGLLGVDRLLVGYQPGMPDAFSLELSKALSQLRERQT